MKIAANIPPVAEIRIRNHAPCMMDIPTRCYDGDRSFVHFLSPGRGPRYPQVQTIDDMQLDAPQIFLQGAPGRGWRRHSSTGLYNGVITTEVALYNNCSASSTARDFKLPDLSWRSEEHTSNSSHL